VSGIFPKGAISPYGLHGFTIRYNYIHDTTKGIRMGGIGTPDSGSAADMSYVYQNLIVRSGLGAIIFLGFDSVSPARVIVANNTIDSAGSLSNTEAGGILQRPGYSGYREIRIHNNIVTNSAAGFNSWETAFNSNPAATTLSHNNYFNNANVATVQYRGYALSSWQSNFGKDAVGTLTVNPLYRSSSDFRLSNTSPLLNAGLDVLDLDRDGNRNDPIAMGAYITGNEIMGIGGLVETSQAAPNPPANLE
jgi:hypothetical protein